MTLVPSHANRIQKKSDSSDGLSSVYLQTIMNGLGRAGSFCPASSLMTQQKQVVSQLPFARSLIPVLRLFLSCVLCSCHMPRSLVQEKAYQVEQQRLRTERRIAQLEKESHQNEIAECKTLLALLWVSVIVWFYARLYFGSQEQRESR